MSRRSFRRSGPLPVAYHLIVLAIVFGLALGLGGLLGPLGRLVGAWWLLISIVAFLAFVLDKGAARGGRRRTSEGGLLWLVAAGGTLGAGLAMLLVRHKTSKGGFLRPFWWIVGLQVAGWLLAGALSGQIAALIG